MHRKSRQETLTIITTLIQKGLISEAFRLYAEHPRISYETYMDTVQKATKLKKEQTEAREINPQSA